MCSLHLTQTTHNVLFLQDSSGLTRYNPVISTKSNIFTEAGPRLCPALTEVVLSADLILYTLTLPYTDSTLQYSWLIVVNTTIGATQIRWTPEQLKGLWEDAHRICWEYSYTHPRLQTWKNWPLGDGNEIISVFCTLLSKVGAVKEINCSFFTPL